MIYRKCEKRIDQTIPLLEKRRTHELEASLGLSWSTASTKREYGDVPAGNELGWRAIRTFPFQYGKPWTNFWFSCSLDSSKLDRCAGDDIYLELMAETDAMVYINGSPQGATNPFHPLLKLNRHLEESAGAIEIKAESWGGHFFPGYHPSEGGRVMTAVAVQKKSYPLLLQRPRILAKNRSIWDLYYDVMVLRGLSLTLDENSMLYMKIVSTLHEALLPLDFSKDDMTLGMQAAEARNALKPLLDAKNGTIAPKILSIGNAHLDHAWLWPIAETTRKAARTALNMTNYMDDFKDFSFMFTQPVQMLSVKEKYPSVYHRVLEAYKEGRWEPQGASWVEPDCMLPCGEALIRQFIEGLKANRELYPGYNGKVFWIPDSFGYNAQLPQILKGCGMEYFVTSKIGWNDTNAFPYGLFQWEGLDGTRMPAHMIIGAYEGRNDPVQIKQCWDKIRHKDLQPILARTIGEGDGGGGTMLEDLEEMEREHDLQGLPRNGWSGLGAAMEEVFKAAPMQTLPVHKGELYLELHRGTYTVQADIKKYNRELETALHNADVLLSMVLCNEGRSSRFVQARELVQRAWRMLLTNQFHDILPGSCINRAMEEAKASYKDALAYTKKAMDILQDKDEPKRLLDFTFTTHKTHAAKRKRESVLLEPNGVIRTPWCRIQLDDCGGISSLQASSESGIPREIVKEGRSLNTITLSPDTTINWDAWDMEYDTLGYRTRIGRPLELEVEAKGCNAVVRTKYRLSEGSSLTQTMTIYANERRMDFDTIVDWHEEHKILRAEFPTTIRSQNAKFAAPFGHVERSTTENTSMERAQFEVPAHRWTLLEDAATACVLASATKYGYRVKDGEMSISLLRSPGAPDPMADIGRHSFSYSFFVEEPSADGAEGSNGLSKAIDDGYRVSNPPLRIATKASVPVSFDTICGKVVLETVKVSESGDGIVLRFYEALGSFACIDLSLFDRDMFEEVYECDMIEENFTKLEPQGLGRVEFTPFKVRSFAFKLRQSNH